MFAFICVGFRYFTTRKTKDQMQGRGFLALRQKGRGYPAPTETISNCKGYSEEMVIRIPRFLELASCW